MHTCGISRLGLALTLALVLGAPIMAPARAASSGTSCPGSAETPFLPWTDPAAYVLAPGGDFEGEHSWQTSSGVRIVQGNEPFRVHDPGDRRSLYLPAGGSAVTPPICAGLGEPTLRLFAVGGGELKIEVLYETALGPSSHTVARLQAMPSWAPTLQLPFLANALGLSSLDGLTTTVRFRFTAVGEAGWQIDDLYVDPWKVD